LDRPPAVELSDASTQKLIVARNCLWPQEKAPHPAVGAEGAFPCKPWRDSFAGTDPQLTHMGNPWLFRFRPNDIYSARVIADYGVKTLGRRKWAILHSTDAFGTSGMKNLVEDLKGMDVEPALVQGYTNNSQDFMPVVFAIKQAGADVMATYMTFPADQALFAR
jgi:branched-chain amino acid transport system substrate-binding protein